MNMYVSNLGFGVQDEELKKLFTPYGEVSSAKVINDKMTGRSRGFGFVEMPNDKEANEAMSQLDNAVVEGRSMRVSEAKPREDRSSGRGGGFNKNKW